MISEVLAYYQLGMASDPDMLDNCLTIKPSLPEARQLVAEEAYIDIHGRVPEWSVFIESFEIIDGNYLFIHRDPDAAT